VCNDYNSRKGKDAKRLGAHEVLISKDEDGMKNTKIVSILFYIPVGHEMDPYLGLLKIDATMVLVGAVELKPFHGGNIIMGRKRIAGSLIGGIKKHRDVRLLW
jgi:uncharacterized zinc-type alcohol dehydrogenase-like protein